MSAVHNRTLFADTKHPSGLLSALVGHGMAEGEIGMTVKTEDTHYGGPLDPMKSMSYYVIPFNLALFAESNCESSPGRAGKSRNFWTE